MDVNGNSVTYRAALTGMSYDDKSVRFAARAYVEFTMTDGNVVRVYSSFNTDDNVRSMRFVADAALKDVKDEVTEANDGFDYKFPTADGKYSCYSASEQTVLKNWI